MTKVITLFFCTLSFTSNVLADLPNLGSLFSRNPNRVLNPDLKYLPLSENESDHEIYVAQERLSYINDQPKEYLHFAGKIGNSGSLPFVLFSRFDSNGESQAYQLTSCFLSFNPRTLETLDEWLFEDRQFSTINGCRIRPASTIEFDTIHQHEHAQEIASYELREGRYNGTLLRASQKVSYALVDSDVILERNRDRIPSYYFASGMLVSPGYYDDYRARTPGQEFDITGLADGIYVIILQVNEARHFTESNYTNNKLYVRISLSTDSSGLRTVTILNQNYNHRGM